MLSTAANSSVHLYDIAIWFNDSDCPHIWSELTAFESSNTYSVLQLITSENETTNIQLQGHKIQNVIIYNYKSGLIEVKHFFFFKLVWCAKWNLKKILSSNSSQLG
jgi:hypothetical protein